MESSRTTVNNALIVERSDPVAVLPEEGTPEGSLFLSSLDQVSLSFLPLIYSFHRSDANLVDRIKQALSKVLVHYYPLAGRLAKDSQGKWIVDCKKIGVPFVEASATCNIEDLGEMRLVDPHVLRKLVYRDPCENIPEVAPLLTAQVTRFSCGGFTLGIALHYCVFDGTSTMNFMNSWAEIARGGPLSLIPCHDRILLKSRPPAQITDTSDSFVHISDLSNLTTLYKEEQIVWRAFHFGNEKLAALKKMVTVDGQVICSCSSFVALTALVWRARNMALKLEPHQLSKLLFAVDFRSIMKPQMPAYIGNALVEACCLCTAGELKDETISFTAGRIKKAIERVNEDYVWSWIDSLDKSPIDLHSLSVMAMASWQRFDYGSTDFGWGKPRSFGTGDLPAGCLFLPDGAEMKGIVVMLGLPLSAMNIFEKLVQTKSDTVKNAFAKL